MKEWETSNAPRYGRGITKQEVNVDESSDSDATPLAQRKRGQPSDLKGKGPKKPKPEGKKGGTPAAGRQQQQQQQAVFLAVLVLSPSVPRACTIL